MREIIVRERERMGQDNKDKKEWEISIGCQRVRHISLDRKELERRERQD